MSQPVYNLRNIRKLLTAAFTDQELSQLCYEIPEFRPVYEQFTAGMSKDQMIQRLIEYCERKVLMEQLLEIIREEAPEQYTQFADSLMVGGKKSESSPSSNPPAINEVEQLQKLLIQNTRMLYELQLQEAQYGLATPPHIKLQIEDLEKKIDELKHKLNLKR